MIVPQAFLIDGAGVIVWRQAFSKANKYENSGFEIQISQLLKSEELYSNGPNPNGKDEELNENIKGGSVFDSIPSDPVW